MKFKSNIEIQAGVEAGGSTGSNGQVLSSTGSGVAWINQGAVTTASDFVFFNVKNETGSTILKGKGVMAVGTDGNSGHILIDEMIADGSVESKYFLGVLEEDIANGGFARVISFGQLDQFNTTGQNGETWDDGQILWCDPANPGDFTITEPDGPNVKIAAAFILNSSTNGKIQIRVQANEGVHDLHDTKITSQVDGDVLVWDNTTGVWFNDSTLNVDYTNGRVGIGTTNPYQSKLHVLKSESGSNPTPVLRVGNQGAGYTSRILLTDETTNDANISYIGSIQSLGFGVGSSLNQMVINSSGNVGIGTTSPADTLQIDAANSQLRLRDTDDGKFAQFSYSGGKLVVRNNSTTTTVNQFTLDATGQLGIGTISPTEKLEVAGNVILDSANARLKIKGGTSGTNSGIDWTFNTDSTVYAKIELDYDTRASTGLLIDSGYPMTLDYSSGSFSVKKNGSSELTILNGNVGIGTDNPDNKLSVAGNIQATNNGVDISDNSDWPTNIIIGNSVYPAYIKAHRYTGSYSNGLDFYYSDASSGNSTLGIRLNSNGDVGIGTTSPATKLDVDGVITATGGNSTQWNTAYTDRNRWDGGATGLNASNGRISLGLGTLATLNSVNAATITDNSVGAAELNVSGNGTTTQYLRSDGDGTFTWATPPDNNTTYTAGGGLVLNTTEFSHADTSSQASVDNSNGIVIQDVTLDTYGHVTGLASVNLDGRYYTETESDSRFVNVTGDTMTGPLTIDTGSSTNALVIKGTSPTISLLDDSGEDDFYIHVNSNNFYVLVNRDANDLVGTGYESPHPLQLEGDTNIGYLFDSRIFADNYHPNADAWTTARTITIGNTGKSVSGSANVSWTLAEIGATNEAYVDLEIATRTPLNDIRSLGTNAFTNGTDPNITTAQVMAEIEGDGGFDSYSSVFKTSWSYAGNYNLTDAGNFTETAGSSWITWTDNSSDTTRGNITALAIAPNTGASAGGVFIYNDQGSGYSPGWRQVWTSTTDGSGSGLDADLLDGQQGSYYAPATGGAYLPLSGGTMSGTLNMNGQTLNMVNGNITAINNLTFNDPGPNEGIEWNGGNGWKIYESPDNLTTNSGGSLQFVTGSTRRMTIDTSGNVFALGSSRAPIFYDSSNTGYYLDPASTSNLNVVNANQFTGPLNGTANGNAFARGRVVNNCNDAAYRVPGMYGFNGNPTNGTGESYGTMIVAANSDTGLQIAGGYQNDDLYFRGWWSSGAGYGSWRRILHDANYTSWVPSKTGSGASGTWGISITGNATTATTAAWADQVDVNGSNSGGGEYPVMWNSGDTVYSTAGITINRDNKSITASGSLRAPIFYDSNDTGYYLNPASTSTVNKVNYINNSIPIVVKLNSVHKSWAHHVSASDDYVLVPSGTDGGEDWAWSSGFNFNSTGNITANNFILRSDERLKTKITDLPCDNIDAAWKSFELKSDKGNYRTGVIAQELEIKHPEFVNTDNEGFKSVKYIDLLIAKIAELEARLEKAGI